MTRRSSIPSLHVEKLEDRCNPSTLDPSAGALADRPSIDAHAGQTIKILSQPLDPAGANGATTVADDVWVDGKIIIGQNFDTAPARGAKHPDPNGGSGHCLCSRCRRAVHRGSVAGATNYGVGAQAEVGEILKYLATDPGEDIRPTGRGTHGACFLKLVPFVDQTDARSSTVRLLQRSSAAMGSDSLSLPAD